MRGKERENPRLHISPYSHWNKIAIFGVNGEWGWLKYGFPTDSRGAKAQREEGKGLLFVRLSLKTRWILKYYDNLTYYNSSPFSLLCLLSSLLLIAVRHACEQQLCASASLRLCVENSRQGDKLGFIFNKRSILDCFHYKAGRAVQINYGFKIKNSIDTSKQSV